MGMFAVKNDKGEWLSFDSSHESVWDTNNPTFFNDKSYAEAQNTGLDGSHIVELVEAPAKVVVSEEEAKMLTEAKTATYPAEYITRHACLKQGSEDGLMRAYVNGYTVANEKKYNVKVPHTKHLWYYKSLNEDLRTISVKELCSEFTEAEIEQYGLQDCEKKEVTDNEI